MINEIYLLKKIHPITFKNNLIIKIRAIFTKIHLFTFNNIHFCVVFGFSILFLRCQMNILKWQVKHNKQEKNAK
jgi:hypothetical protein